MMDNILLIHQIFVFLNVALGCFLAFWVLLANPREKLNRIFFIVTILMVLWVIFAFLGFSTKEPQKSLIWYRLNDGIVALFFIASYFFSIYFPKKIAENRLLTKFVIIFFYFIFLISVFTDLITYNVIKKEWGMDVIFGKGKLLYYVSTFLFAFLYLYILFKKYFFLSREEKLKVQYCLVGIVLFALFNLIFNIGFTVLTGSVQFQHFGDYSVIFFLGFTAYAIVKRELFGIKVILTQILVGAVAFLLLIQTILSKTTFEYIWKGGLLGLFLIFGYLLIKSVQLEVKRREELENLTFQLQTAHVKLDAAYKKLEKLDKAKSEFISIASHQLRTPLTAIKGYISMILEGTYGKISEKMRTKMESVYHSNERLIRLVNDLLSMSRIEAGVMELELEKTSLEELISSVVEELRIAAEKKNIYLKWEKPKKPLPEALIDRYKLRQVILNIIDNAIKYTKKGGITVRAEIQDSKFKIKVKDTGAGMTKDELSKIFESFSRGRAGTQLHTEGAGLGLYIARRFVEMHKGKIWAESKGKSKGSTFHIELPMK